MKKHKKIQEDLFRQLVVKEALGKATAKEIALLDVLANQRRLPLPKKILHLQKTTQAQIKQLETMQSKITKTPPKDRRIKGS